MPNSTTTITTLATRQALNLMNHLELEVQNSAPVHAKEVDFILALLVQLAKWELVFCLMLHTLCNTFSHYSQPQTVTHTVVLALGAPHIPEQSLPPIKQPSNTVVSDAITTNTCSTELFAIISSMQITPEQQLQKQQKLQNASQQPHFRSTSLCGEVDQMQKAAVFAIKECQGS
ncbi:uncharacterized protein LOC110615596 isoform X2 [Manihot esculenta]|uniref:uncharacterized protein LOC110615596 isoform X2 n=1 Tax=Manihot esculenta TaxID=3983 RepID=UPI000B5D7EBE|nr:uncharacterized protein LOC110615596 isoform X2 [Manihot esculenta]